MSRARFIHARVGPLRIIGIVSVIVAIYYIAFQLTDLTTIITILTQSLWGWISVSIGAMLLSFFIGGIVQYISGNFIGRLDYLCAIAFAGSFLNHFLPLSIGAIGLTSEYYHRLGRPRSQAILMATIPIIIGSITIILLALILAPSVIIQLTHDVRSSMSTFSLLVGLSIIIAIVSAVTVRYKQKMSEHATEALDYLRSVKKVQLTMLIALVSAVQTLASACVLIACVYAINADISFMTAIVLLIITVLVSEGTPIPGGIGATEVVLIFGLANTGLSPEQSVAVTVLFRFVTFILPIIPGGIALTRIDYIMKV